MRYTYLATNEILTEEDINIRLDEGFDFKCNECKKSCGDHVSVLAEGIFCKPCQMQIIEELKAVFD